MRAALGKRGPAPSSPLASLRPPASRQNISQSRSDIPAGISSRFFPRAWTDIRRYFRWQFFLKPFCGKPCQMLISIYWRPRSSYVSFTVRPARNNLDMTVFVLRPTSFGLGISLICFFPRFTSIPPLAVWVLDVRVLRRVAPRCETKCHKRKTRTQESHLKIRRRTEYDVKCIRFVRITRTSFTRRRKAWFTSHCRVLDAMSQEMYGK